MFPLHPTARLRFEPLEDRSTPATAYLATDLVSDQPGVASVTDPTLVNAWGISLSPLGGAFWVSANGTALSEVYPGDVNGSPIGQPFKVMTPGGLPTGQVFAALPNNFVVNGVNAAGNPVSAQSVFIFAGEGGTVTGWNPGVFPTTPTIPGPSRTAIVGFQATDGAAYMGMALANNGSGNFLYLADFRNGKVDVLNSQFQKVSLAGSFTDPDLPKGYAPFNVAAIGGKLFVSYAKQEKNSLNPDTGHGRGFVSVFDLNGNFEKRLISRGDLNAPWGMVQATANFGDFSNALLVGNFGSGRIQAYDATTGSKLGTLSEAPGRPVEIEGLWGLAFGNGRTAGDANSLYYAAGPDDETHGLFGKITANAEGTNPVSAKLTGSDLNITGSRNSDRVVVQLTRAGELVVKAGGHTIGTFDPAAVGTIHFSGFAGNDLFVVDPRITSTVFADGGAGHDALTAGGGSSILLGNTGNDLLVGGASRDVLIGGDGRDFLFGFGNDDIVIGGPTVHDTNKTSLMQILAAWNSDTSYTDRIAAIRAGTSSPKLDSTTVLDDGDRDHLFGGFGLDWFFAGPNDKILGKRAGEQVN
ncbi:MAG: TIGR03118 family protein [Planctomycetia bacterium]|nr:TIGR03118 family protein [Planctomycetia bacterium]